MGAHDPLVLVAEDDPDIRALVRNRISGAGFRVAVAAGPLSACVRQPC